MVQTTTIVYDNFITTFCTYLVYLDGGPSKLILHDIGLKSDII